MRWIEMSSPGRGSAEVPHARARLSKHTYKETWIR